MPHTSSLAGYQSARSLPKGGLELILLPRYLVPGMGPLSAHIYHSFIRSFTHSARPCGGSPPLLQAPCCVPRGGGAQQLIISLPQPGVPGRFQLRGTQWGQWAELDPLHTNRAFPLQGTSMLTWGGGVLAVSLWLAWRDHFLTPSWSMTWGDVSV